MSVGVAHMDVSWSSAVEIVCWLFLTFLLPAHPFYKAHLDRVSVPQPKFGLFL